MVVGLGGIAKLPKLQAILHLLDSRFTIDTDTSLGEFGLTKQAFVKDALFYLLTKENALQVALLRAVENQLVRFEFTDRLVPLAKFLRPIFSELRGIQGIECCDLLRMEHCCYHSIVWDDETSGSAGDSDSTASFPDSDFDDL